MDWLLTGQSIPRVKVIGNFVGDRCRQPRGESDSNVGAESACRSPAHSPPTRTDTKDA